MTNRTNESQDHWALEISWSAKVNAVGDLPNWHRSIPANGDNVPLGSTLPLFPGTAEAVLGPFPFTWPFPEAVPHVWRVRLDWRASLYGRRGARYSCPYGDGPTEWADTGPPAASERPTTVRQWRRRPDGLIDRQPIPCYV